MENEDWKIIIDSEHCPFCVQDLTAHEWYCDHSQNKGKECAEGLCPVFSQQKDAADECTCKNIEHIQGCRYWDMGNKCYCHG